jgi:hypothetical protein
VGLIGDGETGPGEKLPLDGDRRGDFNDSEGRVDWFAAVEMLRDNLGLAALEASMLTVVESWLTGYWSNVCVGFVLLMVTEQVRQTK